jgi:hypothetical protein
MSVSTLAHFCLGYRGLVSKRKSTCPQGDYPITHARPIPHPLLSPHLDVHAEPIPHPPFSPHLDEQERPIHHPSSSTTDQASTIVVGM